MHKIGYWICFFLMFILPKMLYGQPYYFNHYQITEGLSNNTVICSLQDSYGFMWFGTKDGLDRFDGNNFKHFDIHNKVRNTIANNIISLIEDHKKQIWIGTDQGIYLYDPVYETFKLVSDDFANADVPVIKRDIYNNIWFISNGILHRYDVKTSSTQPITDNKQFVTAIYCASDGLVYYGTLSGQIKKINSVTKKSILIDLPKKYGEKDWFSIQKIIIDKRGNLLFGTSKAGVGILPQNAKEMHWLLGIEHLNQYLYVRDIIHTKEDEYWFATELGLFIYAPKSKTYIQIQKSENNPWGISDNAIYNILEDKDGGIWLGTYFGGINYYNKNNSLIEKYMSKSQGGKLLGTVVRIINKDKSGNIWLGTENGGISKLNPLTGEIENYNSENNQLTNNNIHGLLPMNGEIILGAFVYGMDIFDYQKKKVVYHFDPNEKTNTELKSNFIYYLYKTQDEKILAATTQGHYLLDKQTKRFQAIDKVPIQMSYTTILEDRDGNIWMGTWRDGIYRYHPQKPGFNQYIHNPADSSSLPNNKINCLFQDSKGQIWVATEGGIALLTKDNSGEFSMKNLPLDLPSIIILSLLEDKDKNLWISTSKGLVRYDPQRKKQRLFNMESGLPSMQFNYNSAFDDGNGKFYFGTINGMISFEPDKLNQIKYSSNIPLYITKLAINNKEIHQNTHSEILNKSILFTDKIELDYDESSFSLDFTALQFESPHSIKYSYKMDGLNKDWIEIEGSNRVHFTKLLPGNYEFIVKAEDPNGTPISSTRTLKIKVLPPIWASIPAFILYFIIIIGLLLFIAFHFRERVKQRNKQHLLTIQNLREQELYQSKINFYTDVVHEIRTPLTLIKAPLEKLVQKIPANPVTDKLLMNIQSNTERLISLSNQLLDFRKVETKGFKFQFEKANISQFTQKIIDNFAITLDSQNKKLVCSIKENIACYVDLEAFEKITHNLLNNALKYSESYIEVILNKDEIKNTLVFIIKNDGKVIPVSDREFIFEPFNRVHHSKSIPGSGLGLALCQSLVLKHRGVLKYTVDDKNLNTFTLTIPLNQTHIYEYKS